MEEESEEEGGKKEGRLNRKGETGGGRRCCTRHKHTGTLEKFNTHTLGLINLTLVPAKGFRV